MRYDILVIGGGIVGSSVAYHLARTGRAGRIGVIERDASYEHASTPRGSGGIRQLFSLPENVAMARYGLDFYEAFADVMAVDGEPQPVAFRRQGYLFLSDAGKHAQMEANFRLQEKLGVGAELLSGAEIGARFPSIATDDVVLGVYSPRDAWVDAWAALQGFRRKARSLGVDYLAEDVAGWDGDGLARRLRCASGAVIEADTFVLAAGPWSGELAAMIGMPLPVEPMAREAHFFRCATTLEPLPFIKTESDLAFRPEGQGYTGGVPDWSVPAGWDWNLHPTRFEDVVWPALAHRLPAMRELRLERSWRGHYDRNAFDLNAVLGPWTGGMENVFLAAGFSGHGIMHAPAAGLATAEWILDGACTSLDVARFGHGRIPAGEPYRELGIV